MKTLIIDDDPLICAVLSDYLPTLGLTDILVANNGEEAAWVFAEHERDIGLVFSDINMPKLDGIEFLEFLAAQITPPPIVFISSAHSTTRTSAVALAGAHKLQVVASLTKPINFADVSKAVSDFKAMATELFDQAPT
jgi:CheY-like chemotaxis protein